MQDRNDTKVLIVESLELDAHLYGKILAREFVIDRCTSAEQALKLTKCNRYDLLVLGFNLPGMCGADLIHKLRSRSRREYVAIIAMLPDQTEANIQAALTAGADGFGAKSDAINLLMPLAHSALRIKDMTDELRNLNRRLRRNNLKLVRKTQLDSLTGLYNMNAVWDQLNYECERAQRFNNIISVLMIDIDHFKEVNDKHDHLLGSFVLKELGQILAKISRDTDIVGRYGGDEFIIVLPETDADGALQVAQRIQQAVRLRQFSYGRSKISITLSQGIGTLAPSEPVPMGSEELVRIADGALYSAKNLGRDRIIVAHTGLQLLASQLAKSSS